MYQIDNIKRIFVNIDNNSTQSLFIKPDGFLLPNLNQYTIEGVLLSKATQKHYDGYFAAYLDLELNLKKHNIKSFLNFHFEFNENKIFFLEHLEYYIIPDYMMEKDPIRLRIINEWISEKKKLIYKAEPMKPQHPTGKNITANHIREKLNKIHHEGWNYVFRNETDYTKFIELFTLHFEFKDYTLPETPIQLKHRCKTKVATLLKELHSELKDETLKHDKKYFTMIEKLSPFTNEADLYKTISR
jgi:hypothetical protein